MHITAKRRAKSIAAPAGVAAGVVATATLITDIVSGGMNWVTPSACWRAGTHSGCSWARPRPSMHATLRRAPRHARVVAASGVAALRSGVAPSLLRASRSQPFDARKRRRASLCAGGSGMRAAQWRSEFWVRSRMWTAAGVAVTISWTRATIPAEPASSTGRRSA